MEEAAMSPMIRVADSKGRITLPGFANATVVIETLSENEYRVRKAKVIPEDELRFPEEHMPVALSERDAQRFLQMLESPPKPNAAARRAAKRSDKDHG
jgi:hypothetical protein